ncbi:MAG: OstA-like protein [Bacteroidota bacterium]
MHKVNTEPRKLLMKTQLVSFLIICFFLTLSEISAQETQEEEEEKQEKTRIQLVQADYMNYDKDKLGPDIQRLVGNVIFEHDSMYLHCDSAYLFEKDNSMDAWGNIHIEASDSVNIYGDELSYDGNERMAEMRENVKLVDNQITLTTDYLDYDLAENTGKYTGGGKIVDTTNRLTSRIGYYYANDKDFFFKDDVKLKNPRYTIDSDTLLYNTASEISYFFGPSYIRSDSNLIYCENGWYDTRNNVSQFKKNAYLTNNKQSLQGDSLYYDRDKGLGKAFQNVFVIDSAQNVIIQGEYARFLEKTNNSMITDSAQAIQIEDGDSLFMHADTLRYIGDTINETGKKLFAYYNVKYYRFNLQGKCDSLAYTFQDSLIKMYDDPFIWSGENQLYADSIIVYTGKIKNKKMMLYHSAYMAEMDQDSVHYNQIKGKNMFGFFRDDELYKVDVEGNAETIYFVRNDDDELVGINKAESSDLVIHIKNRRIHSITFQNKPDAKLHPQDKLSKSEKTIKGFIWNEKEHPKSRYDIFN